MKQRFSFSKIIGDGGSEIQRTAGRGSRAEDRDLMVVNRALKLRYSIFWSLASTLIPRFLVAGRSSRLGSPSSACLCLFAATAAPIHDIVDAIPYFPYPVWMAVSVAGGVLGVVAAFVWFFFFRKRPLPQLTPQELALVGLGKLAKEPLSAYEFAVRISDILRTYVDKQFGVSATTATSMEFLNSIQHNAIFSDRERQALGQFLQTADFLKYARAEADSNELKQLFDSAERLISAKHETGGRVVEKQSCRDTEK